MTLWERIQAALEPAPPRSDDTERQLRLATGALLLEMCRADFEVKFEERQSIADAVRSTFGLTPNDTRELLEEAQTDADCAVSLQIYTSLINEYSTTVQKHRLIEDLWRVAFADGELHRLEASLIDKIGELLNVSGKTIRTLRNKISHDLNLSPDITELPA